MHVHDAAAALIALLRSDVTGPVNVGSGEAVAVHDILDRLGSELGNAHCLLYGQRPLPAGDPAFIEADVARLASEVGFRPRFDLAAGLADAIRERA